MLCPSACLQLQTLILQRKHVAPLAHSAFVAPSIRQKDNDFFISLTDEQAYQLKMQQQMRH